ncbi:hypothetical protein ABNG02_13970 [Halorubrum ejinorense]|jgi:hypothetical protein|uniref:DUF8076 domain-containing protein n=1 Tax=Halorubrum ejinorense TaxID=425309 RepID=A0AAV3SS15_9EURY
MSIQPGFNVVTEPVAETGSELTVFEFFRALKQDKEVDAPVTVTHLDRLLVDTIADERDEVLAELRGVLRQSRSLDSMDAVQFVIDGRLVEDAYFRIRVEYRGDAVYLDVGELFVEEPKRLSPTHAVARK